MKIVKRFWHSRWGWFVDGLPVWARARALFRARRYTMTSPLRCSHLWDQSCRILDAGVPGSFVECGVWRGGSAAVMGLAMRHSGKVRNLHLFDSFEGLPEPTTKDGDLAVEYSSGRAGGALKSVEQCVAGLDEVRELLIRRLQFDESKVHFHVGWFQNTLPVDAPKLGNIALLRLDGDWYESTRLCLEHLYPLVAPGGLVIMDDYYAWQGCRQATDEFRQRHNITTPLSKIDYDAVCWTKS